MGKTIDLDEVERVTAKLREEEAERYRQASRPGVYGAGSGEADRAPDGPLGDAVVDSDAYKQWMAAFPSGAPPQRQDAWSARRFRSRCGSGLERAHGSAP